MILKNNLGVLGGFGGPERSWEVLIFKSLKEFVTDLLVERTLRVRRDFHIGRVMIRLVDELGKKKKNVFFWYLPTICVLEVRDQPMKPNQAYNDR